MSARTQSARAQRQRQCIFSDVYVNSAATGNRKQTHTGFFSLSTDHTKRDSGQIKPSGHSRQIREASPTCRTHLYSVPYRASRLLRTRAENWVRDEKTYYQETSSNAVNAPSRQALHQVFRTRKLGLKPFLNEPKIIAQEAWVNAKESREQSHGNMKPRNAFASRLVPPVLCPIQKERR